MHCLGVLERWRKAEVTIIQRPGGLIYSKGSMRHKNPLTRGWVPAHAGRGLLGIAALSWCAVALCSAPAPAASGTSPDAISSITLERNCYGCGGASVLVLQRDGHASYTVTGNARLGTSDQTATGTVSARDFEKLARLALQKGFFELAESYADPELQDGAWVSLRIVRGNQDKQVFNRNGAGPVALQTLERGVDDLKTRIKFAPASR
jgi:hypothetical protein